MKPRLDDGPSPIEGLCTQPKRVDEFTGVANTNTSIKVQDKNPASSPANVVTTAKGK